MSDKGLLFDDEQGMRSQYILKAYQSTTDPLHTYNELYKPVNTLITASRSSVSNS